MAWLGRQRRLVAGCTIVFVLGLAAGVIVASLRSGDPATPTSTVVRVGKTVTVTRTSAP